jgi:CRP-like cAMP-binding protein
MNVLSGYQLKVGNGGNTHIIDFTFGQEWGYVAMIVLYDRAATAVANEDSIVLEVPCVLFSQLRDTLPADLESLLINLSREMTRRIRKADELNTVGW